MTVHQRVEEAEVFAAQLPEWGRHRHACPAADRVKAREALRATPGMEETPALFVQSIPRSR
ncbi:hypothetical protein [Streptomyces sp. NPDC002566]|uniref:hypothetical protein n=1 Tax=Streptomyces sp. NPDC002566 TaxID=3364650 RepID=UPI0036CF9F6A